MNRLPTTTELPSFDSRREMAPSYQSSPVAKTKRAPVSVLIPALNEELNLRKCLQSVQWADEILVIDSGSKDRTAEIAEEMGAKVVDFRYQPGGPRKKNWALANLVLQNDWVLFLDADERIPAALAKEIERVVADPKGCRGFYINRKLLFLGQWLQFGGNYPSWNLRLFDRRLGRYESLGTEALPNAGDVEVHEHVLLDGKAGYLREPMLHEDCKDLSHFLDRHNRYSTWDAVARANLHSAPNALKPSLFGGPVQRKRWLKKAWAWLPLKPLARFVYLYVFRLGFLDGYPGFAYACLKGIQEFHIALKAREMRSRKEVHSIVSEKTVSVR